MFLSPKSKNWCQNWHKKPLKSKRPIQTSRRPFSTTKTSINSTNPLKSKRKRKPTGNWTNEAEIFELKRS